MAAAPTPPPPTVTICVTTHRLDYLFRRAVHSIIHQIVPPDEVIVVVDGLSWKASEEKVIKELPSDWKIFWTENENNGPAMPRNMGMYYATGDWILILDGDDFLVPSCIESYLKILPHIRADMVAEFQVHTLVHKGVYVSKSMPPDRASWNDVVRMGTKTLISGNWKRGDLPLRPILIRNEGKKYYPIDYNYLEDKVLIFHYMIEERKIIISDYCGYIRNTHPRSHTAILSALGGLAKDDQRFRKIAANININNWTLRDRVFDAWKSHLYLTDEDRAYIDDSVKYFSVL